MCFTYRKLTEDFVIFAFEKAQINMENASFLLSLHITDNQPLAVNEKRVAFFSHARAS